MSNSTEPSTREKGLQVEAQVAQYLAERGYAIVDRNVRTAGGELDIVAWDHDVLCFIEVRSTRTEEFGGPLATITRKKQLRVARAAKGYLLRYARHPLCRFDVVGVVIQPWRLELVRNAFVAS